jgi:hypothetical protein
MTVQRLPAKPDYLSQADFDYIIARDGHRCVFYGNCPHAHGNACCDEQLDFDHAQPSELGGDDTIGNVRLLCKFRNRGRPVEPLKKWAEPNHWDNKVSPGKLREIQRIAGWDAIDDIERLIKQLDLQSQHLRRQLLDCTTFLAGATGIGKNILCQSVFFRINQTIGRGYPRIKNVLWLTNDTTLRDTGMIEIENDAFDLGFDPSRPTVHPGKSFADIDLGPNTSDVKIAAVQSLWKVEQQGELRRSDREMRDALSKYDTIVFDECDWANDQVRRIAHLGNHALQFSLTASPPIDEIAGSQAQAESFLRRFVLITDKAIADYQRAVTLDSCLKFIGDEVIIGAPHEAHAIRDRGSLQDRSGKMEPDHVLFRSAVCEAIKAADNLEARMQKAEPEHYYSPHIMVRMSSVADVRAMCEDLTEQIETMYGRGVIKNSGWGVSMIFQGHARYVQANERDLAKKDTKGRWVHPFMLACNNGGRAIAGSRRVLIMCNIGVRGINNWTVSHIVDCTRTTTPVELIQFDYGRPLRWRSHIANWIDESSPNAEFAQTRIYIPQSSFQDDKRKALLWAAGWIKDMLVRIGGAGFLTWSDLVRGKHTTDPNVVIDVTNQPLTDVQRFQVQKSLADALAASGAEKLTPELVRLAIDHSPYRGANEAVRRKLIQYAQELADEPALRQQELVAAPLIEEFKLRPACVMEKLHPQDRYEIEDLVRWVKNDPDYDGIRDEYLQGLKDGQRMAIHAVSQRLRDTQIANYRPAARTRRLQGHKEEPKGVLPEVATELIGKLRQSAQECDSGLVYKAVNGAANFIFQISADEGGPMDHPAYHIAILGRYRDTLQSLARGKLISNGSLGSQLKRFAEL